ncbi:MAG: hypothetical protein EXS09_22625 [Gemmataceae bacterium]|nr:hypothetical protein [Gemmataceae bacterium]
MWPEQLIALEAVIREDVVRCMDADIAVGERGRMAEYYSALTAPGWRKPALPPVISRAATEYLPQALSRFTLALKSPDLQNAQRLRTACDQVVRAAILAPGHPLLDRFAVLSMKLSQLEQQSAEEQCREESVELLQQTVRRGATEKELDRAYEHAKQTGAQIPKGLQGRFDDAMHKHEGRRTIKQVILGVIGISLGTVALVVFLIMVLKK